MPARLLGGHTKRTVDRKTDLLSAANSLKLKDLSLELSSSGCTNTGLVATQLATPFSCASFRGCADIGPSPHRRQTLVREDVIQEV